MQGDGGKHGGECGEMGVPRAHLALELALLLEAQVLGGVCHHGEGLLRVVSAEGKYTLLVIIFTESQNVRG